MPHYPSFGSSLREPIGIHGRSRTLAPEARPSGARHLGSLAVATVLAAALVVSVSRTAMAACQTQAQGVLLCTGNVSNGVRETFPATRQIIVRGVTTDIATTNQNGISLIGGNPLISVDLGGRTLTTRHPDAVAGGRAAIGGWGSQVTMNVVNTNITASGSYTHGVVAGAAGTSASLFFRGNIDTSGIHSRGIWVNAQSGAASLTAHSVISTTGALNADAIKMEAATGVVLNHTGISETTGLNSEGMYLRATRGFIRAATNSTLTTHGDQAGAIEAHARDAVNINQRGNITTHGDGAHGILALSDLGNIDVATFGSFRTNGDQSDAVRAVGRGAVKITTRGPIVTTGDRSMAINAQSTLNSVNVVSRSNIVTMGTDATAIIASAVQNGAVDHSGNITTNGANARGISVSARRNAAVTSVGAVTTRGATATGIVADAIAGSATITHRGTVDTAGTGASGILASSRAGNASVTTIGAVRVAGTQGGTAIDVSARGGASLDLSGSASSNSTVAPTVRVAGYTGSNAVIKGNILANGTNATALVASANTGRINIDIQRGLVRSGPGTGSAISMIGGTDLNRITNAGQIVSVGGHAIDGSAFADSVTNTGLISGRFRMGDGNDSIVNSGTVATTGDSDFGGGAADIFVNNTTLDVAGTARFLGLETFNNVRGTIDMQDGRTDGQFQTSGAYAGGGQLVIDSKWNQTDVMVLGGTVSGQTKVDVAYQTGGGTIGPQGLPVIDVSAGTTTNGQFVLANGPIVDGLLNYDLELLQGGIWALVGAPNQAAMTLLANTSLGSDAWTSSSSAFDDFTAAFRQGGAAFGRRSAMTASRFSSEAGGGSEAPVGAWMTSYGGGSYSSELGAQFSSERTSGYQAGVDYSLTEQGSGGPRVVAGVTFGASRFTSDHAFVETDDTPNSTNAGVYAAFADGVFDMSVLAKTDQTSVMYQDSGISAGELDLATSGLQLRGGYTLPGIVGPWSMRLDGGTRYTHTRIEDTRFSHIAVSFDSATELVAVAGATLGFAHHTDKSGTSGFNMSLSAHIEQDLLRRQAMNVAGYDVATDDLRTMLDLGAALGWQSGNFSAGGDLRLRHDLMEADTRSNEMLVRLHATQRF